MYVRSFSYGKSMRNIYSLTCLFLESNWFLRSRWNLVNLNYDYVITLLANITSILPFKLSLFMALKVSNSPLGMEDIIWELPPNFLITWQCWDVSTNKTQVSHHALEQLFIVVLKVDIRCTTMYVLYLFE